MKIYLVSSYFRRVELCEYRKQLESLGHVVTSRWLNGDHQTSDAGTPIGESGEKLIEDDGSTGDDSTSRSNKSATLRNQFATEDFRDVIDCDLLIAFTEPPRSQFSRGGRHVKLGLALGMMKRVWIVGHRENIFCWLEDVRFFESIDGVVEQLRGECEP
mgnify:CR=1 FL=1